MSRDIATQSLIWKFLLKKRHYLSCCFLCGYNFCRERRDQALTFSHSLTHSLTHSLQSLVRSLHQHSSCLFTLSAHSARSLHPFTLFALSLHPHAPLARSFYPLTPLTPLTRSLIQSFNYSIRVTSHDMYSSQNIYRIINQKRSIFFTRRIEFSMSHVKSHEKSMHTL